MKKPKEDKIIEINPTLAVKEKPKDWLPRCYVCNKIVDKLVLHESDNEKDIYQKAIRRYTVYCHGEIQNSYVGLWAAQEYQRKGSRLPDAFKPLNIEED